jgi:hypothetical protein
MSTLMSDRIQDREGASPGQSGLAIRVLTVVALGLAVGAATAVLQSYLDHPWASLVNAASPWVSPAFVVGTLWRRIPAAAIAGAAVCALELVGYYATDSARGYPASHAELVFWGVCAVVGGPVFGAAGWMWKRGTADTRGVGAATLAAAFLAEAIVSYGWRLHYWSSAALFAGLGIFVLISLDRGDRQGRRAAGWLVATLPVGLAGELLLGLVHR